MEIINNHHGIDRQIVILNPMSVIMGKVEVTPRSRRRNFTIVLSRSATRINVQTIVLLFSRGRVENV